MIQLLTEFSRLLSDIDTVIFYMEFVLGIWKGKDASVSVLSDS